MIIIKLSQHENNDYHGVLTCSSKHLKHMMISCNKISQSLTLLTLHLVILFKILFPRVISFENSLVITVLDYCHFWLDTCLSRLDTRLSKLDICMSIMTSSKVQIGQMCVQVGHLSHWYSHSTWFEAMWFLKLSLFVVTLSHWSKCNLSNLSFFVPKNSESP